MDYIEKINKSDGESLEFGSGGQRGRAGYITVDLQDLPAVDICMDAYEALAKIDDNKIDKVYASHFIEHIDDLDKFLREIVRVCKNGATIEFRAPHFSNAWFYSDVTHKTFFGLYSFSYLATDHSGLGRPIPGYARIKGLELANVKLGFGTLKKWFIRYYFRKVQQVIVNSTRFTQELYEDAFAGIFPCYDVHYFLRINK